MSDRTKITVEEIVSAHEALSGHSSKPVKLSLQQLGTARVALSLLKEMAQRNNGFFPISGRIKATIWQPSDPFKEEPAT